MKLSTIMTILGIVLAVQCLFAQTEVSGEVSGEWTVEGSPYLLVDTTCVTAEDTLIILPGVTCNFNEQPFLIYGALIAEGTEEDSIILLEEVGTYGLSNFRRDEPENASIALQYVHIIPEDRFILAGYYPKLYVTHSTLGAMWIWGCEDFRMSGNLFLDGGGFELFNEPEDFELGTNNYVNARAIFGRLTDKEITGQIGEGLCSISLEYCENVDIHNLTNFSVIFGGDFGGQNQDQHRDISVSECFGGGRLFFQYAEQAIAENCEFKYGISVIDCEDVSVKETTFRNLGESLVENADDVTFEQCIFLNPGDFEVSGDSRRTKFDHCTFIDVNRFFTLRNAIGFRFSNNIVFDTEVGKINYHRGSFLWRSNSSISDFEYNCFYGYERSITGGREGDTLFARNNIYVDPLLVGGRPYEFYLRPDSPCIDAGNPEYEEDPDGTRTDIGAYWFNQDINNPPVIYSRYYDFGGRGKPFRYVLRAVDDEDEEFELSFEGLPQGIDAHQEADSTVISGILPEDQQDFTFLATVSDQQEASDTLTIEVIVYNETILEGAISGELTVEDSPYRIVEHTIVPDDAELRIGAGVEVIVNESIDYQYITPQLDSYGSLFINGTEDQRALFRTDHLYGVGIDVLGDVDTVIVQYCDMNGTRENSSSIDVQSAQFTNIHHSNMNMNIYGGNALIEHNTGQSITTNNTNNSIIRYNKNAGILAWGDSVEVGWNEIGVNGGIRVIVYEKSLIHHNLLNNCRGTVIYGINLNFEAEPEIDIFSNSIINNWAYAGITLSPHVSANVYNNVIHNSFVAFYSPSRAEEPYSIHHNLISECDFLFNEDINQDLVESVGELSRINDNGDSTDAFGNIFLDAELIDFGPHPAGLRSTSPAIDAGDPDSPSDPDTTVVDIGYRPLDWGNQPPEIFRQIPNDDVVERPYFGWASFEIEAEDEEDDSLYARFVVDDDEFSTEWADSFYFEDRGVYRVMGEVTDGNDVSQVEWVVLIGHTDVDKEKTLPLEFSFETPYPNPFNSQTTLSFSLPHQGSLSIDIYDLTGRRVQSWGEMSYQAGHHRIIWSPQRLPSGSYFIKLASGDEIRTNKITLLK